MIPLPEAAPQTGRDARIMMESYVSDKKNDGTYTLELDEQETAELWRRIEGLFAENAALKAEVAREKAVAEDEFGPGAVSQNDLVVISQEHADEFNAFAEALSGEPEIKRLKTELTKAKAEVAALTVRGARLQTELVLHHGGEFDDAWEWQCEYVDTLLSQLAESRKLCGTLSELHAKGEQDNAKLRAALARLVEELRDPASAWAGPWEDLEKYDDAIAAPAHLQ